jgi:molybdopterin-biosynthesis enzyme MoeA-like protein
MTALSDRTISTAGCLVIGDEVLSSKTMDTNSAHFGLPLFPPTPRPIIICSDVAKYCFEIGIDLKRIEVIADDEGEIIEAVRRMSSNYDMVVTSGGVGPTHDDMVSNPTFLQ